MTINLALCPFTVGSMERTFAEHYSERVSVKDFGAVGDGSTDDWRKIMDAVEYLFPPPYNVAGPAGGHLHFPAGHYMVSKSINLRNVLSGLITGDGAGSTRITFNGPLRLGRTIAGFTVNGTGTPGTTAADNRVDAVFDCDGMQTSTISDLTLEMLYSADQTLGTSSTFCLNLDKWSNSSPYNTHGNTMMDMAFIGGDRSVGMAAGVLGLLSILGSEMSFIHCKFTEPSWNAIKSFSLNSLSHHCWFCHFIRCGKTPTVVGDNAYAAIHVHQGAMVAIMFCIFEDSKDCDYVPGTNTTYMIACHHRSTVAKNIDNGPSMVAVGSVRGQGLTFENTTSDDTMIFKKCNAVLDVCNFKTGYASDGEDYMVSHFKACTFGKASPFANAGRITIFVDDAFVQGPGLLTPLVTGAPVLGTPTFSVGA